MEDLNINIYGSQQYSIAAATEETFFQVLDTECNKCNLKMDIAYIDHSYLIGKRGSKIQNISREVGCQIHFPDGNKHERSEKSNQVVIIGQSSGVEKARCKLRSLLPIAVTFELPAAYCQSPPDFSSPAIQLTLQKYRFVARYHQVDERIFITARGIQQQYSNFRQGLHHLMEHFTRNDNIRFPVTLETDIGLQNQAIMGPTSKNIQQIEQNYKVKILFQSTVKPITDPSKNPTEVAISGAFDDVYKAWKQLMGYIPIKLSFNLKKGQDLFQAQIDDLGAKYKVNIMSWWKTKENVKMVTVQGPERDSRILFEVRREVMDLDKSEVPVCCNKHTAALLSAISIASTLRDDNNNVCKTSEQTDGRIGILNDFHSAMANVIPNFSPVQMTNPKISSLIDNVLEQLNKASNLEEPIENFQNNDDTSESSAEFSITEETCRPTPAKIKRNVDSDSSNQLLNESPVNKNSCSSFSYLQSNPIQNEFSDLYNPLRSDIWPPGENALFSWPCRAFTGAQEKPSVTPTFDTWSVQHATQAETNNQSFLYNHSEWGNGIMQSNALQDQVIEKYEITYLYSLFPTKQENKDENTYVRNSSQNYQEIEDIELHSNDENYMHLENMLSDLENFPPLPNLSRQLFFEE